MCSIPAAALIISAAGTVASLEQQRRTANQQQDLINEGDREEKGRLRTLQEQQNQSAQEQQGKRTIEALKEEGRLRAIGAETGLFGTSYDRSAQMVDNSKEADLQAIEINRARALDQNQAEGRAQRIQTRNQMNGVRRASSLGTGLQIAGAGLSAYGRYRAEEEASTRASKP